LSARLKPLVALPSSSRSNTRRRWAPRSSDSSWMVRVGVDAAAGAEADDALVLLCAPAPAPEEDEDDDVDAGADLAGGVRAPGRG
jgi:hypothetical protein